MPDLFSKNVTITMKRYYIKNIWVLLSILALLPCLQACKADDNLIGDIPENITVKMGYPVNLAVRELNSETLIIPYVKTYTFSENTHIAEVDGLIVEGINLGTTTINIYKDSEQKNLIKKVVVTVVPTVSLNLTCGQVASAMDYLDLDPKYTYGSDFKTSDQNIVLLNGSTMYALLPGNAKVKYESHMEGPYLIDVTVNKYTGSAPYTLPAAIIPKMTEAQVKEIMNPIMDGFGANYTITEGYGQMNYQNQNTVTFSPYGNAKSITFYFYNGITMHDIKKGELSGFVIEPNADPTDVIGYVLSNYKMGDVWNPVSQNPILGFRTFYTDNSWNVTTEKGGGAIPWSSVIFNYK